MDATAGRSRRFASTLLIGCLAAPVGAATFTVTTANDRGPGSLREAMIQANAHPGADLIAFSIPGPGPHTIRTASPLPAATDPVTIDGYTQPGSRRNTRMAGDDAEIAVELSGENAPAGANGLTLTADGCVVRGLAINGFHETSGGSGGVAIDSEGIGELIAGNFIGTDASGLVARGNTEGIWLFGPTSRVGGTDVGDRNIVSGSQNAVGIRVAGTASLVQGNLIGTDASGVVPAPNHGAGIFVEGGSHQHLGGTAPGAGNVIAFNGNEGVSTSSGLEIVSILGNSIFDNFPSRGIGGIDIGYDGLSPNDACDADAGDENRQNFPLLSSAVSSGGAVDVVFTLPTAPFKKYRVEFFANDHCEESGYGEGRYFLGAVNVTASGGCVASATAHLDVCVSGDLVITATATDPEGSTSEFSACIPLETRGVVPCRRVVPAASGPPLRVRRTP